MVEITFFMRCELIWYKSSKIVLTLVGSAEKGCHMPDLRRQDADVL